jgi:hypothetical protein
MSSSGMLRRVLLLRTDVKRKYHLHYQGRKNCYLVVINNVVPRSLSLYTLMMEAIRS